MKKLLDSYIILKHRKGKYNDEILKIMFINLLIKIKMTRY